MSFYSEIAPFIEHIHSIRKLKDYLVFDMKFSSKWIIPRQMSDDENIVPYDLDSVDFKGISFVSEIKENEVTTTINKIEKIIKLNKEKEQKEKLFKEYVEKLKGTFESNSIDKLKNLHFEFEESIKLDNDEQFTKSENVELVEPRENERRDPGTILQEENNRTNKKIKKRGVVSEA